MLKAAAVVRRLWAPVLTLFVLSLVHDGAVSVYELVRLPIEWRVPANEVIEVLVWLTGAFLANRVIQIVVWDGLARRALGRMPPKLVIQMTGLAVFLLAVSGIIGVVFHQSVTGFWAASGAVGIVIGFALRNLILDTFSGLAIHLERPFKVGDWINCHTRFGEYIGRVEETNWRTTRLWTTSRNVLVIPNSFLTTTVVTNFSMPGAVSRFELDFTLDFSVPTERAVRVLTAALKNAVGDRGPLADPAPKVRMNAVTPHGIEYRARYYLDPVHVSPSKARNTIIDHVIRHMNHAGLSLSYPRRDIFLARMPWRQKDWTYLKDQVRQLGRLSLFSVLSEEDLNFIAEHMWVRTLPRDAVVVRQGESGESMFIVAEGLLDVFVDGPDGVRANVASLAPGTFFGEKSLLTGEPRSATVVCSSETTVCEISKDSMSELFAKNPKVAPLLSRAIAEREIHNQTVLADISRHDLDTRVDREADHLLGRLRTFFRLAA